MKRKNAARNALFTSIISLLLCVSMLVGTTFAWFTDEVKSGRNVIAAGNLDVELYANGDLVDSGTVLFDDVDPNLWEPGALAFENLQVKNAGSLALKYNLDLTVLNETVVNGYKLSDVIMVGTTDYTIDKATTDRAAVVASITNWVPLSAFSFNMNGKKLEAGKEDAEFGVVLYWKPNANEVDNRYNLNNDQTGELKLEIGVNLFATQQTHEDDSFGNDYDEGLDPASDYLFTGAEVNGSTTSSGTFTLGSDIKTSDGAETDRYGYGYEYIIRKGADYTLDLNGKTIVHDTVNANANKNALTYLFVANNPGTKLTINGNGTIKSHNPEGYACAVQGKDGTLITVNGGDYQVENGIAVWAGAGAHIIINDGSFVNGKATTDHELIYSSGGVIDIYGGFFHNTDGNYTLNVEDRNRSTGFINVYGGTYVNFDPSTGGQDPNNIKVAAGYKVISETKSNGDVWYTVVPE